MAAVKVKIILIATVIMAVRRANARSMRTLRAAAGMLRRIDLGAESIPTPGSVRLAVRRGRPRDFILFGISTHYKAITITATPHENGLLVSRRVER
ncbi:MAG: hypothetical protein AB8G23_24460 [Myxococcota bacterium]